MESCGITTIDKEIKDNLLENMLRLYLRVRAFSLAKDLTNKCKATHKKKTQKTKGLRKDIKKSSEKPITTD